MGEEFKGPWGAPAMYALEGGSIGFQIGGQATDLVLLIMNERGASSILNSKVKLGADASVAAGPVGRDASADTDAYLRSEVLSYSRSRGLLREYRSRAQRFVPTMTPRQTSMAANQLREKLF
jgi:lipid-binding SYLF domain-containing protein